MQRSYAAFFKRYLELGGKLKKLYRELKQEPYLFPEFESWVDPRDVARITLQKVPDGYHMSLTTLAILSPMSSILDGGHTKVRLSKTTTSQLSVRMCSGMHLTVCLM